MHFFHLLFLMTVLSRSNLSRLWVSDVRHAIEYAKPPSRPPSHSPAVLFTCVTSLVECSSLCMRQKAYTLVETRAVPECMQTGFATIQTVPKLERCAVLLGFPFLFSFFFTGLSSRRESSLLSLGSETPGCFWKKCSPGRFRAEMSDLMEFPDVLRLSIKSYPVALFTHTRHSTKAELLRLYIY